MQDEILIKYLLGEATVEEAAVVDAWLEKEPANQAYLLQLRQVWDKSRLLDKSAPYNTEQQWQLLKTRMHQGGAAATAGAASGRETTLKVAKSVSNLRWAAAVIVVLLGSWFLFQRYFNGPATDKLVLTATASPITDTLSDGSIITLNRYSRLQAPLKFSGHTREVNLQAGEAFFKVVHNAKNPFLVHSGKVDIKVLGTSFNVKNKKSATIITVATGKVQVVYKGQHMTLLPHERAEVDHDAGVLSKQTSASQLYNYYVTRQFVASNTRLEDLVNVLNEAYGVHIVFGNDRLKDLRMTTVFKQQSIDKILEVIGTTFNLQVVHQNDRILLKQ